MAERKDSMASKTSRRFYRQESTNDLTKYWDYGEHFAMQNRWCFEAAWEVGNKVGGIYTVIRLDVFLFLSNIIFREYCDRH